MTAALVLLFALHASKEHQFPPLPPLPREFRGIWLATVANIDWPTQRGESTAQARAELANIAQTAQADHFNALLFQVRPSADALYKSSLEPWSEYLTGRQGQPPDQDWDPLTEAIQDAHANGLELHAWFNPFRAQSPAQKGPNAPNHVANAHPEWVKKYGPFLWIDPGEPAARAHCLKVFLDVLRRYDVDGLAIDDYFYPYKEKGSDGQILDFPDDASYSKYIKHGGKLARDDWRRENVNSFIHDLYTSIKKIKPWVKFGISPFGIYRPGYPPSIKAGVDQYADLYADAQLWFQKGWCDYLSPQLYWPIAQKAQAYNVLQSYWLSVNTLGRHLWPSNYTENLGRKNPQEIIDQINSSRAAGASGNIQFSFKTLKQNPKGLTDLLLAGPYSTPAAVPESPWLGRGPEPEAHFDPSGKLVTNSATRFIYYSALINNSWTPWSPKIPQTLPQTLPQAALPIDRYGRAGKPAFR